MKITAVFGSPQQGVAARLAELVIGRNQGSFDRHAPVNA